MNGAERIDDGLVLAAGASSRMGSPKALLTLPDGQHAMWHQTRLLADAGCRQVVAVIGCHADRIAREQPLPTPGMRYVVHNGWEQGRLSSLRAGLRALKDFDGVFVLPVDAVGISARTLCAMRNAAYAGQHDVIRARYQGQHGYIVWLSQSTAHELLEADLPDDAPVNVWLNKRTFYLDVNDPAIRHNANTPGEWLTLTKDWPIPPEKRASSGR
jgi:CTP:molybdopterin cytidylyltransferase MocA